MPARHLSFVRAIAGISLVYDGGVGLVLLLVPGLMASAFGVEPAHPRIFSDLNALFLMAIAAGYYAPYRDPAGARWYLWVMGPGLKGAGAAAFVLDYVIRHSPASFLLFAASDGTLAILTLIALLASRGSAASPASGARSTPEFPRR